MLGEFDLIARYFAPLSQGAPGSYGLRNDAALIVPRSGESLVATADTLVAGVHFLPDDPAELVARKALRVNLSDLAAMGAEPLGYLLTLAAPKELEESWLAEFVYGLAVDQGAYGVRLLGGDTTSTPGPLTLTVVAFGSVPAALALDRQSAQVGDGIYLSGTLGDAALGLRVLQGRLTLPEEDAAFVTLRYRLPAPRVALGQALRGRASACLDVSDGLLADLGHLCRESGVAARLEAEAFPLSRAGKQAITQQPEILSSLVSGGDDYELLFTLPVAQDAALRQCAQDLAVPVTQIGRVEKGQSVRVYDGSGRQMAFPRQGWTHF
jgi:thiamine-monophosphate kinase|tara:strand:+ start:1670 stop:2641 length:972 start_codon:yes stop_codon:yes gene_type:complete